jgi:DNA-binding Lrp family transcriptional regulator
MLTEIEKKIIASIQADIPVIERPFLEIANQLGISEDALMEKISDLSQRGVIRRFGATIRHQMSGYTANAMTAWKVEDDRKDEVGEIMASFREVSHCYVRKTTDKWPYNLYTMIHAKDEESCHAFAREMSKKASVDQYTLLFSVKELKKTSMKYFEDHLIESK